MDNDINGFVFFFILFTKKYTTRVCFIIMFDVFSG
jgi:hypothetical protein